MKDGVSINFKRKTNNSKFNSYFGRSWNKGQLVITIRRKHKYFFYSWKWEIRENKQWLLCSISYCLWKIFGRMIVMKFEMAIHLLIYSIHFIKFWRKLRLTPRCSSNTSYWVTHTRILIPEQHPDGPTIYSTANKTCIITTG